MEENNNQIKIKLTTVIVLILLVVIVIIGIILVILNRNNNKVIDEEFNTELPKFNNEERENILLNTNQKSDYDSRDSNFNDENITIDEGMRFINNEVLIMFNNNVKESRCEEIINEINGKIISSIGVVKEYEVQVNYKFTTYSSIEQYCKMLEETYDEITRVSANTLFEFGY